MLQRFLTRYTPFASLIGEGLMFFIFANKLTGFVISTVGVIGLTTVSIKRTESQSFLPQSPVDRYAGVIEDISDLTDVDVVRLHSDSGLLSSSVRAHRDGDTLSIDVSGLSVPEVFKLTETLQLDGREIIDLRGVQVQSRLRSMLR